LFFFHVFSFFQLIYKGYKGQRGICIFRETKNWHFIAFAACKRAKTGVLFVSNATKEQKQAF
jgi:hypothetical protein